MDEKKNNSEKNISKREDIEELSSIYDVYSDDDFDSDEEIISHSENDTIDSIDSTKLSSSSNDSLIENNENEKYEDETYNNKNINTINNFNNDVISSNNDINQDIDINTDTKSYNIDLDNKVSNEDNLNELDELDDFEKEVADKYAYSIVRDNNSIEDEMENAEDKAIEEGFQDDEMYQDKIKPFVDSKMYDKAKESLYKSLLHNAEAIEDLEERDVEERSFYAALFLSGKPVEIKTFLKMFTSINLENRLLTYVEKFNKLNLGMRIIHVSGGYQIVTDSEVSSFLDSYFGEKAEVLSKASLETLSIIAYKQPITKAEIEDLRGVISSGPMKYLLDRNLIRVIGRKEVPGRPLLYATTNGFLEYFGINSLSDLPTFREWMELKNNQ